MDIPIIDLSNDQRFKSKHSLKVIKKFYYMEPCSMIKYGRLRNKVKPKYSFFESRKKFLIIGVMIFAASISAVFLAYLTFGPSGQGQQQPTCGTWDWNANCELSPTAHMVYGDLIIGGFIALLLS
jgi:hypothetical protein